MEYKVVCADSLSVTIALNDLQDRVNQHLKEGWVLQGGVSITLQDDCTWFYACQAMVKPSIDIANDSQQRINDNRRIINID